MSRVINTSSPGSRRNHFRRTIAEILRRLMLKSALDEETKDMAATVVVALRGIAETIEESTYAWERRNYFLKADRFRRRWAWVPGTADRLQDLVAHDHWDRLPQELALLVPYFRDIRVLKFMRSPSTWTGNYRLLQQGDADGRSILP